MSRGGKFSRPFFFVMSNITVEKHFRQTQLLRYIHVLPQAHVAKFQILSYLCPLLHI